MTKTNQNIKTLLEQSWPKVFINNFHAINSWMWWHNTSHANDRSLQRTCRTWAAEQSSVCYEKMQKHEKMSSWCWNRRGGSVVSSDSLVFMCLLLDVGNLWISSHTSWTCGLLSAVTCPLCGFLFSAVQVSGMHSELRPVHTMIM